jgi:hypothetical protein
MPRSLWIWASEGKKSRSPDALPLSKVGPMSEMIVDGVDMGIVIFPQRCDTRDQTTRNTVVGEKEYRKQQQMIIKMKTNSHEAA